MHNLVCPQDRAKHVQCIAHARNKDLAPCFEISNPWASEGRGSGVIVTLNFEILHFPIKGLAEKFVFIVSSE